MYSKGQYKTPAPVVQNCVMIKEKKPCDKCSGYSKYSEGNFYYFTYNGGALCRACARKLNLI